MIVKKLLKHKTAILLTLMLGIGGLQVSCEGTAGTKQKTNGGAVAAIAPKEKKPATRRDTAPKVEHRQLVVYYFMTTYRCPSCYFIEEATRKAIDEAFVPELKSGRIVFKMIDVEEKDNAHFVDEYKLYTKSVVLSDLKDGKEASWKYLDQVWNMIGKEDQFKAYIVKEVKAFLGA